MYEDDLYDPTLPNDYDMDYEDNDGYDVVGTAYEQESASSFSQGTKRKHEKTRKISDPQYSTITKTIDYKKVTIGYYHTRICPGATIRNAVSGSFETGYRVGSCDEDLFFKVMNAIGSSTCRDPHLLFYDSPEQYERHLMQTVDAETKDKWRKKVMTARALRLSREEPASPVTLIR